MKKRYFEKTGYIVFSVVAILAMIISHILNILGHMSSAMLNIIVIPLFIVFIATYVYMINCAIKDRKLRDSN